MDPVTLYNSQLQRRNRQNFFLQIYLLQYKSTRSTGKNQKAVQACAFRPNILYIYKLI